MKLIGILTLLFILAVAEVSTTGYVYQYLGMWKLILVYIVTTGIGAAILFTQKNWISRLSDEISKRSKDKALKNELNEFEEGNSNTQTDFTPKIKRFSQLVFQYGIWIFAWISVLIPGLVTDLTGYLLILVFFYRKKSCQQLL